MGKVLSAGPGRGFSSLTWRPEKQSKGNRRYEGKAKAESKGACLRARPEAAKDMGQATISWTGSGQFSDSLFA